MALALLTQQQATFDTLHQNNKSNLVSGGLINNPFLVIHLHNKPDNLYFSIENTHKYTQTQLDLIKILGQLIACS